VFTVGAVIVFPQILWSQKPKQVASQILTTVAGGLAEIYAGRVISGVGIGAISAVAPTYVSECSPKLVRGRITGLFQIMVAMSAPFLPLALF
jgi:MFS family permease